MQSIMKPSDSTETPFYGLAQISGGKLHVSMPQGKWDFGIDGSVEGGANPKFNFDSVITAGNDKLKLAGLMTTKAIGRMSVNSENLSLAAYAPLVEDFSKKYFELKDFSGDVKNLHLLYDNEKEKLSFSGEAEANNLKGKVVLSGNEYSLSLNGKVKATDNVLTFKDVLAKVDENQIDFAGVVDLTNLEKPKASGSLTSKELAYDGRKINDVVLPFVADGALITVNKAGFKYGDGNVDINASYAVEDKSLAADFNFKNIAETLPEVGEENFHINGSVAVLAKINNEKLNIQAAADTVDFAWRNIKLNHIDFDGDYDGKNLTIGHLSALSDQGNFATKGTVGQDGALNLEGGMSNFPIDPFINLATGQNGSGLANTAFKLKGTTKNPEFEGLFQFKDINFMKQNVKEGHGFISLKDHLLNIKNLEANMPQGKHVVNGSIDLAKQDAGLNLIVESNNVRIEPLVQVVTEDISVTGNLDNVLQIQGSINNPKIYGEAHASDGSAQKQLFSNIDGRYSYEDGLISLRDFVIDAFLGKITLDGKMTADKSLDFKLNAQNIDLNKLPIKDSEYDLDGLLNAHGRLLGTMDAPYFEGGVDSKEFFINKEKFTKLDGNIKTNIKDINHLEVSFNHPHDSGKSSGCYKADINLDRIARRAKGQILATKGNVAGILRAAKQPYHIQGDMDGVINISPNGPGSGIHADVEVNNVKLRDVPYHKMKFQGKLAKGIIYFDNVILQEKIDDLNKGVVTVAGDIDLRKKIYNVVLNAKDANPSMVTTFMNNPPEVKGEADLDVKLTGPFAMPNGVGEINIKTGSVAGVSFDNIIGHFNLANDNLKILDFIAAKNAYSVKAAGDVPVDLFRLKNSRKNPEAEMNISVDLSEARLGILPVLTKYVEWATGETEGKVNVVGTLEEPRLFGKVKITDGNVKVKYIDTVLENINLDADFQGKTVVLADLSTKLGKGKFSANGSYSPFADAATSYNLNFNADNVEIKSEMFSGIINGDIQISPQKYFDFSKTVPGKTPSEAWRSLIKGNVKLDDVLINVATVPETGEGESNLGLDLKLELGKKVHMLNSKMYDIWLKGGLDIKGSTRFPMIDGSIQSEKGTITYLRTHFKLDKAKLIWLEPGSFLPNVDLSSRAKFSRYNIFMDITGPVAEMDLKLTSDPSLERNTLVRMLTLQRDSAEAGDINSNDVANLASIGLEMAVLADVEMWIKQTLGLDQFRVYTGKVRSGVGFEGLGSTKRELTEDEKTQYNLLVSKYLTDKFLVGYTTSFNGLDRTLFGQYDISKHLNLTYSRSYELDSKPKNWYGLEYNVNF